MWLPFMSMRKIRGFFLLQEKPSRTAPPLREKNVFFFVPLRIRQEYFYDLRVVFWKHKILAYTLAKTQSILVKVSNTTYVDHHWRQDI